MILPNKYTLAEANAFIDRLRYWIDTYGLFTVADVYDLQAFDNPNLDISSLTYEDNKRGWCESNLKVSLIGNYIRGYAIELSRPLPIV